MINNILNLHCTYIEALARKSIDSKKESMKRRLTLLETPTDLSLCDMTGARVDIEYIPEYNS